LARPGVDYYCAPIIDVKSYCCKPVAAVLKNLTEEAALLENNSVHAKNRVAY
jgi:hypothetical protein